MRDPRVVEVLTWFGHCYDVEVTPDGRAFWRRVALPAAGGIGDQDAWLLHGMEHAASVHQDLLEDSRRRAARARNKDE